MTTVLIEVHGNRLSVKVSAMQNMSTIVEQVLQQAGLADSVTVSDVRLLYNKRDLDQTTPFRFLNIPAGARIELVTGLLASLPPPPYPSHRSS